MLDSCCITDAYFSFCGLVLDIDMNCGCLLYSSFYQIDELENLHRDRTSNYMF